MTRETWITQCAYRLVHLYGWSAEGMGNECAIELPAPDPPADDHRYFSHSLRLIFFRPKMLATSF